MTTTSPDVITQLRDICETGTRTERKLAEAILGDISFACQASVYEIANRAGTSQPSLTRLCHQLGYTGLREFKLKLAQALVIGESYLSPPALDRSSSQERIVAGICEGAIRAVTAVRQTADIQRIMEAAQWIAAARLVYVYGSGGISSMGAEELQNRLFRFGLPVVSHVDGQMQQMTAATAGPGVVTIGLSSSGESLSVIRAQKIARSYGARTIALAPERSSVCRVSELAIDFQSEEDGQLTKPTSARYALLILIDLIAMATAETFGSNIFEGLRRIRMTLTDIQTGARKWPIGD